MLTKLSKRSTLDLTIFISISAWYERYYYNSLTAKAYYYTCIVLVLAVRIIYMHTAHFVTSQSRQRSICICMYYIKLLHPGQIHINVHNIAYKWICKDRAT